jgi:hypothetical protein
MPLLPKIKILHVKHPQCLTQEMLSEFSYCHRHHHHHYSAYQKSGQSTLTFSCIPPSHASPKFIPEVCYGSPEIAGWPHTGSKMCILATELVETLGMNGRPGKNTEKKSIV